MHWILLTQVFCVWVLSDVCHVIPFVGTMMFSLRCAGEGIMYYICQESHSLLTLKPMMRWNSPIR